jgi:hypothetical protein
MKKQLLTGLLLIPALCTVAQSKRPKPQHSGIKSFVSLIAQW